MSSDRKRWGRRLAVLALVPVVMMMAFVYVVFVPPVGYLDFFRNRDRYEAIVQHMKARPPGEAGHVDEATFGEVVATGRRDGVGQYAIAIAVYDRGHAGTSGYLYLDRPIPSGTDDSFPAHEGLGQGWKLLRQVAPHWWAIHDGLD